MKRLGLVALVLAVIVLVSVWRSTGLGPESSAVRPAGEDSAGLTPEEGGDEPAGIATPTPETVGACSIGGFVRMAAEPVAARIEVRVFPRYEERQPKFPITPPLATGASGPDGKFEITGLPFGTFAVSAHLETGEWSWTRAFCRHSTPQGKAQIYIQAGEHQLEGRAIHRDCAPFLGYVGASIHRGGTSVTIAQVATDVDGRFVLRALPTGRVSLTFTKPGECHSTFRIEMPGTGFRIFEIEGNLQSFTGRVIDGSTEAPVVGARILYAGSRADTGRVYTATVVSDETGSFTYEAPKRKIHCHVLADGFETSRVSPKGDDEFVVRLNRAALLTGRVVRKTDGTPVAGARIVTYSPRKYRQEIVPPVTSDAEGNFSIASRTGGSRLYVFGGGWVSEAIFRAPSDGFNASRLNLEPGEKREVVLEVVPLGVVSGRLLDAAGDPVAGAVALLKHTPTQRDQLIVFSPRATVVGTTAADGTFRIPSVIPGLTFVVTATILGEPPARSKEFSVIPGETIEIEIRQLPQCWLPVRVIERDSRAPIVGARVSGRQGGSSASLVAMTGEDGTALLGPLLPGAVLVQVHHRRYMSVMGRGHMAGRGRDTIVDPGENPEEVLLELRKGYFLAGRILTPGGDAPESGSLCVFPAGTEPGRSYGMVGMMSLHPGGEFTAGPIPTGEYDLVLFKVEGRERQRVTCWSVTAGAEDLVLSVDPEQAAAAALAEERRMVVRVLGPSGRPAAGGILIFRGGEPRPAFSWLREGNFVVGQMPEGTKIWVEIRRAKDPDGNPVGGLISGPHLVGPGTLDLVLPPSESTEGRVVGPDGKGLTGLRIEAMPVYPAGMAGMVHEAFLPAAQTDAEGRFKIAGLADGSHTLRFSLPPDRTCSTPPVVQAGESAVLIRLERGMEVRVVVRDPEGKPAAGAAVVADLPDHDWISRTVVAGAGGVAVLPGLDPKASWRLTITPPPGRDDLADHLVLRWQPSDENVVLPPGAVLNGIVRGKVSANPNAMVWWRDTRNVWRKTLADQSGAFRIVTLAAGPVTLCAAPQNSTGRAAAGPEVTVDAGTTVVTLSTVQR